MDYVIHFDIIAFIIFSFLLVAFIIRKWMVGRSKIIVFSIFVTALLSVIFEIFSVFLIRYFPNNDFASRTANVLNNLFYLFDSFFMPLCILYIFSILGLWFVFKKKKILIFLVLLFLIIPFVLITVNIFTKKIFYIENGIFYQSKLFLIYYILTVLFSVYCISILIHYRNIIKYKHIIFIVLLFGINVLANLVHYFYPHLLLELFSVSIICFLIFVSFHRPEDLFNPLVGARKLSYFNKKIRDLISIEAPFDLFFIDIVNHKILQMYLGQNNYLDLLKMFSNYFLTIQKKLKHELEVYYLDDGMYCLVLEQSSKKIFDEMKNHLSEYFQQIFYILDFEVYVDYKICFCRVPNDLNDAESIISFANVFPDLDLNNKRFSLFSAISSTRMFSLRNELSFVIENALKNRQIEVLFQPIYNLKTKDFFSCEAKIRLYDSLYGLISVNEIYRVLSANNKLGILEYYIIDSACQFLYKNNLEKIGIENVQINLFSSECLQADFHNRIMNILSKYNLNPHCLSFGLSGKIIESDSDYFESNVNSLSKEGIGFFLDNYGFGYSSVSKFVSLPLFMIKMDRVFIDEMENNEMLIALREEIQLLKELNIKILFNGLDNIEDIEFLESFNCDFIQGGDYVQSSFFSCPLPEDQFLSFLNHYNFYYK